MFIKNDIIFLSLQEQIFTGCIGNTGEKLPTLPGKVREVRATVAQQTTPKLPDLK